MKKTIIIIIALSAEIISTTTASAQMATIDEALMVADSWVVRVMENEGSWGGYDWAQVADIREFKRNDRVIGYFCDVEPVGFILVSLRKELAPVKAYSDENNLNPESDKGMTDLLKTKMEGILDAIEQPIQLQWADSAQDILEIDYRPVWDSLCNETMLFSVSSEVELAAADSDQVGPLLNTSWHQGDPYNQECPSASSDCNQERCAVGCVALAGAQIMKYWNWPPENYDWLHMADKYIWDQNRWEDGNGNSLDNTYIEAVSIFCRDIGDAVGMQYCLEDCQSFADIFDMNDAYEDYFSYYVYGLLRRTDNQGIWYNDMQSQLKANRPIQYTITGHSIVLDGWRQDGGTTMRQYHMNYGWGHDCDDPEGCNTWYSLDALYDNNSQDDEYVIADIHPATALGDSLNDNWIYHREEFNYRYFDQDTKGTDVTFEAGQNLQFLPGVTVTCKNGYISFESENSNRTKLFSIKGTNQAEIKIHDGGIKLHPGGGLKFY
jgi:hypothetical protein